MNNKSLMTGLSAALLLASGAAGAQSNYPEPFEPQVLYQNSDLIATYANRKPLAPAPAAVATETAGSEAIAVTTSGAVPAFSKEDSPLAQNFPILLVGFGLIGFMVWASKRPAGSPRSGAAAPVSAAPPSIDAPAVVGFSGETGVSKFIQKLPVQDLSALSGVGKYLRRLPPPVVVEPPISGVARYLKKLPKPPVRPTDESGVSKYLKNL